MNSLLTTSLSINLSLRVCSRILHQLEGCSKLTSRCLSTIGKSHNIIDNGTCCKKTNGLLSGHTIHNHNGLLHHTPSILPSSWLSVRTYAKAKDKGKSKGTKGQKKVQVASEQLEGLINMEKVTLDLDKVLEDLKEKFIHQVTVRTSQGVFNNLVVKTPDGNFPLIQLGQVIQKSPQLVVINLATAPQYITNVKEAFGSSGLNINPQQDGTSLFVPIPKVTREHREGLAKNAKTLSEKSKKQLRDLFTKYSKKIKSSKEGHSADVIRAADDTVKELMHDKIKQVDEMTELKRQELMGGK